MPGVPGTEITSISSSERLIIKKVDISVKYMLIEKTFFAKQNAE
jgi:hypothetical protein